MDDERFSYGYQLDDAPRIKQSFIQGGIVPNNGNGITLQKQASANNLWIVAAGLALGVSHANIGKYVAQILAANIQYDTPNYVYRVLVEEAYKLETEGK